VQSQRDTRQVELTLGADHGGALADPPERLAEVLAAADERNVERVLVDVERRVGGRENLGPDARGIAVSLEGTAEERSGRRVHSSM